MRSGSLHQQGVIENLTSGSPQASPVTSPTRLRQETDESVVFSANAAMAHVTEPKGLQHTTSLRRKKSYNAGHNGTAGPSGEASQLSPAPSPLPSSIALSAQQAMTDPGTPTGGSGNYPQVPTSSAGDTTPLPALPAADSQSSALSAGQSSSTSASQIMNENLRPATAQAFSTLPAATATKRPATSSVEASTSGSGKEERSTSSRIGSAIDNPYKSFRVTLEDPCFKVLPAALKKYKINDDWRQYALFICYGSNGKSRLKSEVPTPV